MLNSTLAKWKWIIGILLLLNFVTLAGVWWTGWRKGPRPPRDVAEFFRKELSLSDEQAAQFRDLINGHRGKARPMAEAIHEKKGDMIKVLSSAAPDTSAAYKNAEEAASLQLNLDKSLIDHYLELKAVCTPEQQEKLADIFLKSLPKGGPPPHGRKRRR